MTDASGVVTYSTVITIINKESGFDIRALMPSIVSTSAVLNTSAAKKTQLNIAVTDFAGRQVLQSKHSLVAGSNQITFNFSTLAAGAYQITATTADGDKKTIRFVKQ
jgi:phosphoribosylformylglycinamidine (FGAM) synthase-like amidotransferase family enzyme